MHVESAEGTGRGVAVCEAEGECGGEGVGWVGK